VKQAQKKIIEKQFPGITLAKVESNLARKSASNQLEVHLKQAAVDVPKYERLSSKASLSEDEKKDRQSIEKRLNDFNDYAKHWLAPANPAPVTAAVKVHPSPTPATRVTANSTPSPVPTSPKLSDNAQSLLDQVKQAQEKIIEKQFPGNALAKVESDLAGKSASNQIEIYLKQAAVDVPKYERLSSKASLSEDEKKDIQLREQRLHNFNDYAKHWLAPVNPAPVTTTSSATLSSTGPKSTPAPFSFSSGPRMLNAKSKSSSSSPSLADTRNAAVITSSNPGFNTTKLKTNLQREFERLKIKEVQLNDFASGSGFNVSGKLSNGKRAEVGSVSVTPETFQMKFNQELFKTPATKPHMEAMVSFATQSMPKNQEFTLRGGTADEIVALCEVAKIQGLNIRFSENSLKTVMESNHKELFKDNGRFHEFAKPSEPKSANPSMSRGR
jgi:glycine cleavage system regulatory protein